MRWPRLRFRISHLIILIVAIPAAIVLAVVSLLVGGAILFDDTYYPANKTVVYAWDAGPSPIVEVDLYEGYINVIQSHDGRVSARLTPFAVTKESQAATEAALGEIKISATQVGDTIRIKTTKAPEVVMSQLKADIELRVPPDASLDLLTGHGYIYIGKAYVNAYPTSSPVALKAVKARDMGQDYIGIEAEIAPRPSLPATRLDLESRHGTVVIKGDNVSIDARAVGGAIEYIGRPAAGPHRFETNRYEPHPDGAFRLDKGIKLELPADLSFAVDAESVSGSVSSDFPVVSEGAMSARSLKGTAGMNPVIELRIRGDDGPIELRKKLAEPRSIGPK
jgi:hypothetical protein